jgi:hypothetical protein
MSGALWRLNMSKVPGEEEPKLLALFFSSLFVDHDLDEEPEIETDAIATELRSYAERHGGTASGYVNVPAGMKRLKVSYTIEVIED